MTGTGTSRALARTTTTPALTTADQAAIARFGRPTLLRRLRVQVTAAWSAAASTLIVGFPLMMSEDLTVSDTGVIVTMMSLPAMVVAAHGQGRLTRVRAADPAAPRPFPVVASGPRPEADEVGELADLRSRLGELVTAIEPHFPDVAAAMRSADTIAQERLRQQIHALSMLGESEDGVTAGARAEIRDRLGDGFAEYRTLIAEAALLLARRDSHLAAAEPLRAAADLAATYSEGIRVSERSGGR